MKIKKILSKIGHRTYLVKRHINEDEEGNYRHTLPTTYPSDSGTNDNFPLASSFELIITIISFDIPSLGGEDEFSDDTNFT